MRFDARDLKPYAEPVSSNELRVSEAYYSVNYVDDDMQTPVMETLVFIGRNLEKDEMDVLYFQDITSYQRGIRYASATADDVAVFHVVPADQANHIFEFEKVLEQLMACSLRRRAAGL